MNQTTLTLVRHGRTSAHLGNRYTGSTDLELDEQGLHDAQRLADWAVAVARPSALYASPMTRAMQTVSPVSDALGLPVRTDVRLRELDFGKAEGHTLDEIRAHEPRAVEEFLRDPVQHHWPGGEHPSAAADRATAALLEIATAGPGEHIMIVCHNTLIRLVICRFLGVPLSAYRGVLRGVAPVASTQLTMKQGGAVMLDHYNQPPTVAVGELDVDAL